MSTENRDLFPNVASECPCCTKLTKKRPRYGKLRYPHKCLHGVPCTQGDALIGTHANGPALAGKCFCPACRDAWIKRMEATPAITPSSWSA